MLFKFILKLFYLFLVFGGFNLVRGDCEYEEFILKIIMK